MGFSIKIRVLFALAFPFTAIAGEADVLSVTINETHSGVFSFSVTVSHTDEGWDHYADKWDVIDNKGNILGTRVLHHPHVNEQPFTRHLSEVSIPTDLSSITVRAHDSVHGYGGQTFTVKLP